jgi:hypothetical protein
MSATRTKRRDMSTSRKDIHTFLYWIHDIKHSDIYSEGYVGITSVSVPVRFKQHVSWAKAGTYSEDFAKALLQSQSLMYETIMVGTREEMLEAENHFRPEPYIGWNRASGGEGGCVIKHGLTGHPIKPIYYNMFTRAAHHGVSVADEWCGEGGLERFYKDMGDCPKGYNLTRYDLNGGYGPGLCMWESRKDFLNRISRASDIEYNGEKYNYVVLAEKLGVKPNTLQYRIIRGWTVEEAVVGKREGRKILTLDATEIPYSGALSDQAIREMVWLRLEGLGIVKIGEIIGIDSSQVSRLCAKMGVKIEK